MTREELAEIKNLAIGATPGPWKQDDDFEVVRKRPSDGVLEIVFPNGMGERIFRPFERDVEFVVAANPDTVLRMISYIEELQSKQRDVAAFKLGEVTNEVIAISEKAEQRGFQRAVELLRSEEAESALPLKPIQFKIEKSWGSGQEWADWLVEQETKKTNV